MKGLLTKGLLMRSFLMKVLLIKGLLMKGLLSKGLLSKGLLNSWSIRTFLSLPKNHKVTYVLQISHLCDQRFLKKCQKMPVLVPKTF